jgi:signal transduction histidine kinase
MGVFRLPIVRASPSSRAWRRPASWAALAGGERALLAGLGIVAALAAGLCIARAWRDQGPVLWPLVAMLLWLALMAAAVVGRQRSARLAPALLAGGPLLGLGWSGLVGDLLLLGLFGASLVVGGALADGHAMVLLAAWYALLYVLVALHQGTVHAAAWDDTAAPLVALAAVALSAWGVHRAWTTREVAGPAQELGWLGQLAHQVRTPLSVLRGTLQQLLSEPAPSTERLREGVQEADRAAARLTRLVDDLLLLARAGRNAPPATEQVDVLALVESVYEQGRRWPGGERLHLAIGSEWGDGQLLQQLLLNLVDNALKYTAATAPIWLRLAADGGRVLIAVEDAGAPIPRAEQDQIFEQFYRGAAARHSGVPGSGLGLSVAQWIAQAHGGEIALVELRHGKAFQLRLPARPVARTAVTPPG